MAQQDQRKKSQAEGTEGIDDPRDYTGLPPKPSAQAAAAAGAVGPGALAAEEEREAHPGSGLAPADRELLRGLAQRAGGVDALIRWLELHREKI